MRIVVSGTHASGKSTLVSDFAARHPRYEVLPDPFELLDEIWDSPGPAMMSAQLRIAAERLLGDEHGDDVIAERGPLDFLAYLRAFEDLTGGVVPSAAMARMTALTAEALDAVDLLVLLPLAGHDPIPVDDEEHLELRAAMDDLLLELADDPDLTGGRLTVVSIAGDPDQRLAALEHAAGYPAG